MVIRILELLNGKKFIYTYDLVTVPRFKVVMKQNRKDKWQAYDLILGYRTEITSVCY